MTSTLSTQIAAHYDAGHGILACAKKFNCSTVTVYRHLAAAGVKPRRRGGSQPRRHRWSPSRSRYMANDNRCLPAAGYCPTLARLAPPEVEPPTLGSSLVAVMDEIERLYAGRTRRARTEDVR